MPTNLNNPPVDDQELDPNGPIPEPMMALAKAIAEALRGETVLTPEEEADWDDFVANCIGEDPDNPSEGTTVVSFKRA
jgi:hypothetical protein